MIPQTPPYGSLQLLSLLRSLDLMLNCVRIGTIAGVERIVVAGQNGHVYFFEMPKPAAGAPAPSVRSHVPVVPVQIEKFGIIRTVFWVFLRDS